LEHSQHGATGRNGLAFGFIAVLIDDIRVIAKIEGRKTVLEVLVNLGAKTHTTHFA
jgi:hypothetical protein